MVFSTNKTELVSVASPLSKAALMKKSKDWLARNQNNVSEWGA
jgi:hypothetical protein